MEYLRLLFRRVAVNLGLAVTAGTASAVPAAVRKVPEDSDAVLIVGQKLMDEFIDGRRRTRVIPTTSIKLRGGAVDRTLAKILSPGETYYLQYVCAGRFSDVAPVRFAR